MAYLLLLGFSLLYLFMQTMSIYGGDSGELAAAAYTWGIAHPPGYPLYSFLGGLISHLIPFNTIAWRVGLLSSIPMAIAIFFTWKIIYLITKSWLSATFACVLFGLLYPIWLYAIVPEVFGLFAMFSAMIVYLFLQLITNKVSLRDRSDGEAIPLKIATPRRNVGTRNDKLYILFFVIGLALTHHHVILFLLVPIGIVIWKWHTKLFREMIQKKFRLIMSFLFGFSFYLYAPIASSFNPPFDWEHPANPIGFLRLVTRASYGTFRASYGTGLSVIDRLLNVMSFLQYAVSDWTILGIIIFIIGFIYLWFKQKTLARFFSVYAGFLLFYFFYAGFPVNSDFALGTLERFFIVPYQLIAVIAGVGIFAIFQWLTAYWKKHASDIHIPYIFIKLIVILIIASLATRNMLINYPKLMILKNDKTLENLADDIFASVPNGAILGLTDDTPVYALDYAYYVQKKRQDIIFLSFPMLGFPVYREQIKKRYPQLVMPERSKSMTVQEYVALFIRENAKNLPIMDERTNKAIPEFWVPRGMGVMFYPDLASIPNRSLILSTNTALWNSFHDPLAGVLGKYKHLLLSDVLRYYADKRLMLAQSFLLYEKPDEAQKQMEEAIRLTPKRSEIYSPYVLLLLEKKDCNGAKHFYELMKQTTSFGISSIDIEAQIKKICEP